MTSKSIYAQLGVDAGKENVRQAFSRIVQNDFPGAFVNVVRDPEVPNKVFTMHTYGDGSKFVQRLLHYRETGDETIIQGAVDDAFAMNLSDIATSGFVFGRWVITQIIDIGQDMPKELIMEQIARRVESLLELYKSYGFRLVFFLGGETADLPDQIQSVVYNANIYAEAKETDLIRGNVVPGDKIYGFASNGQAAWESILNSGMMANGLTLARICTMRADYGVKYPYLIRRGGAYRGAFKVTDKPDILAGQTVSQAVLSPTRQWAILIRLLVERLKAAGILNMLHGISINTGGGATKIVHVGRGITYEKAMPAPPSIFRLIQQESGENWRNMFQTFNCGVGVDIVGVDGPRFRGVLEGVSETTKIKLFDLGLCRRNTTDKNQVVLQTPYGDFGDY